MRTFNLTFTWKKETKGTQVFYEDERENEPTVVGTLYIKKEACPPTTRNVRVTVTLEDPE